MTSNKTIHSRSNKDIGDVIEGDWEIIGKKVIAEPIAGDGRQAPRFGIYEYEVKALPTRVGDKPLGKPARAKQQGAATAASVGGTRREASSVPLTVRRSS
jgi:hypothetical protein